MLITNAFSANMLAEFRATVRFDELSVTDVAHALACADADGDAWESAVGHADTAAVFSAVLNAHIECNRRTVRLAAGDRCVIGQYSGPRLPEGCRELPEGASIRWMLVTVS